MVGLLGRKLLRDVGRHRAQFIAIVVTMALGVALFGASYDAYRNLTASYDRVFEETAFADVWLSGGDAEAIAAAERTVPGVANAATRHVADVPLSLGAASHRLVGRIVGLPAGDPPAVNRVLMLDGNYLDPAAPAGVLLERHAADHFGVHPGDEVRVLGTQGWQTLQVLGIVASAEYLWPARSRQDPLTSADDFAVLFVPEDLVTQVAPTQAVPQALVRFQPGVDRGATSDTVIARGRELGAADAYTRAEQPSNALLGEDIQGFGELSVMFPLLFISATMMGTYLLLSRLVRAQRSQIGTLRAAGMGRRALLGHYAAYGLLPGLAAGLIGAAGGSLLARAVTDVYTAEVSIPLRVHNVHPDTFLIGVVMAVVGGGLAAIPAAWSAMRVEPAEAMRSSAPPGRAGVSLPERVLPPLRRLPVRWRTTLRNIGRQRRRTAYTAAGVMLALILVLVSWGMIDTVRVLLARQFDEIQQWDASVYLDAPATAEEVTALAGVEGVARAAPVANVQVVLATARGSYATQLVGYEPGTSMHVFRPPGGGDIPLPADGMLVGTALRGLLGLEAGASVTLSIPSTGATVEAPVAGFVDEPLGTFAYWSLLRIQASFPGSALPADALNLVQLRFKPGADRAAVIAALASRPEVVAASDARALSETAQSFMGFFYVFVGVMLLFGGLMGGALVFNTVSANVSERSAEIASLRAAGMDGGTVARLVGVENLLVAATGVPFGLLAGYLVARAFMGSFSSDLFQFNLSMYPSTFVLSAAGVLLLTVLSEVPALRSAGRLDIASVLRQPGL